MSATTTQQHKARQRAGGIRAVNIVRTLGIFMALAALSFVLGFFVLARLIPGTTKPPMAAAMPINGVPPVAEQRDTISRAPSSAALAIKSTQITSSKAPDEHPKPAAPGPSLDPVNDPPSEAEPSGVQKPRKVDDNTASDSSSSPDDERSSAKDRRDSVDAPQPRAERAAASVVRPKHRRRIARHQPDPAEVDNTVGSRTDENDTAQQDNEPAPVAKSRRTRRQKPVAGQEEQPSAWVDEVNSEPPARRRRADSDGASGAMYHVRLGSFHSRNAAAHEVQRARDKGFDAQMVPVMHNGRTLYRVQAGAFHERDRAETVKQSLQDASLDASVAEQRR